MIYIFKYTDLELICKKKCRNFCLLFQKILALKVMMHMSTRVKDRVKYPVRFRGVLESDISTQKSFGLVLGSYQINCKFRKSCMNF
jgi:hypothetical protein